MGACLSTPPAAPAVAITGFSPETPTPRSPLRRTDSTVIGPTNVSVGTDGIRPYANDMPSRSSSASSVVSLTPTDVTASTEGGRSPSGERPFPNGFPADEEELGAAALVPGTPVPYTGDLPTTDEQFEAWRRRIEEETEAALGPVRVGDFTGIDPELAAAGLAIAGELAASERGLAAGLADIEAQTNLIIGAFEAFNARNQPTTEELDALLAELGLPPIPADGARAYA